MLEFSLVMGFYIFVGVRKNLLYSVILTGLDILKAEKGQAEQKIECMIQIHRLRMDLPE